MESKTKAKVERHQIEEAVFRHFHDHAESIAELSNGFYNASYLIELSNGREVVMKVAPSAGVEVMTYEKDIMNTEIMLYKLAKSRTDIKVPDILAEDFSCTIIDSPYYFMSKLKGVPLNTLQNIDEATRRMANETLAEYMAKLHTIKGQAFGYMTMKEKCEGKGCHHALMAAVDAVIYDARRKGMDLPFSEESIISVFESTSRAFDEVEYPVVCHFDLWDGNIFVADIKGKMQVTGIIDFERGFYACPAADLCQLTFNMDFEKDTYFIDTYNTFADQKVKYDSAMKTRILAYKLYLYLLMHVECAYRDVDGSFDGQKQWIGSEIGGLYSLLKEAASNL